MSKGKATGWVIPDPNRRPPNLGKWLVPLTSLVIFVQLLSGGTFLMADQEFGHMATGLVVIAVAWFGVFGAMTVRPLNVALLVFTALTLVLVLAAALFASKDTLIEHYGLAVAAFGAAVAGTVLALPRSLRQGCRSEDDAPR